MYSTNNIFIRKIFPTIRYLLLIFLYTLFNEHIVAVVIAHIDHIERAAHRVRMSEHTRSLAFAVNCLFCACFKRPMVVCLLFYAISSFRHSLMLSSGCEKCIQNFSAFMNPWKGETIIQIMQNEYENSCERMK